MQFNMADQEMQTSWVKVPNGDLQIDAYLAQPAVEGKIPAIIVIQEIFGVNAHIRDVTERFAKAGYVAIAPAIYQRTAPGFDVGYTAETTAEGRKYKDMTTAAELLSDMQATIRYLRSLPNVKADSIGSIGFCFGGHVVYLAATLPDIKATASFYGGGIATLTPGGGAPTIDRTSEIKGTIYLFFGTKDPLIPNEQNEQVEAALQQHNIPHKVFRYPASHGFFCDQRPDYSAEAAADAWNHVLELFSQTL
ncbi:MAG: dienelactone hydrolase family protein [Elainellaceae cyanobacterium]